MIATFSHMAPSRVFRAADWLSSQVRETGRPEGLHDV
jgi:hypothetical protein